MPFAGMFDPLSISGCSQWIDSTDSRSITSSGGLVSQINDKSGNGVHFSQGTGANQPILGTINGRVALKFDGAADYMTTAAFTLAQPFTLFVVCELDSTTGGGWGSFDEMDIYSNINNSPMFTAIVAGFAYQSWSYSAGANVASGVQTDLSPHLLSAVFNGASSNFHIDGAAVNVPANPGAGGWSSTVIVLGSDTSAGPPALFNGSIGECLLYNSALSATNQNKVEQYLLNKWKHGPGNVSVHEVGGTQ